MSTQTSDKNQKIEPKENKGKFLENSKFYPILKQLIAETQEKQIKIKSMEHEIKN